MITPEDTIKLRKVTELSREFMPKLNYHNFDHGDYVTNTAMSLAYILGCARKEIFIEGTAGRTHDFFVDPSRKDNEEMSVELVEPHLHAIGYAGDEIALNATLIMATKLPTSPQTLLEKIICDSDIWNIGGNEFWSSTDLVRREYGVEDLQKWYTQVGNFLGKQKFYTAAGQALRTPGLDNNKRLVDTLLKDFEKYQGQNQAQIIDTHLDRYGLREAA